MNIFKKVFSLSLFVLMACFNQGFSQTRTFLSVQDTTVGQDVPIRISGLRSLQDLDFYLLKPDQTSLKFQEQANKNGIIEKTIHDLHFQKSGLYTFHLPEKDLEKSFKVSPGPVSSYTSTITVDKKSLEADGNETSRIQVWVRDAFDNPLSDIPVQFISSRHEDLIVGQGKTDAQGRATAQVRSQTPGTSTISVMAGTTLIYERVPLVFFLSDPTLPYRGNTDQNDTFSQFLKAQVFGEDIQNQVAYFDIQDMPNEIKINETVTFKVIAKDLSGEIARDYTGTVRFSSSDDQAELPPDYTFTAEDQGTHTFFLAASFATPGRQSFTVHDDDEFRITGEVQVDIVRGSAPVAPPQNPALQIVSPLPGTYQTPRITLTGKTQNVEAVRIMDGDRQVVEDLPVDYEGNFVFQTPRLGEGTHIFQVFDMYSDLSSETLIITIDSTPPENLSVLVDPQGLLEPGQEFQVFVSASEPLSSVSAIFQQVLTQLIPSDQGFSRTLTAPLQDGEYPIHVIAQDALGNEIRKDNAGLIQVKTPQTPTPDPTPPPQEPVSQAPESVKEVQVRPGASTKTAQNLDPENKVTLKWVPPTNANNIKQYKIEIAETHLTKNQVPENEIGVDDDLFLDLFAEDEVALDEDPPALDLLSPSQNSDDDVPRDPESGEILFFNDFDLTPDNRNEWYVEGLRDDRQYFFRIVSVGEDGQQSPPSQIQKGLTLGALRALNEKSTPFPPSPATDLSQTGSDVQMHILSGVIALLGGGLILFYFRRKKNLYM